MNDPNIIAYAIQAHQLTNHYYDHKLYSVHLSMVVSYALKHISCVPLEERNDVIAACWLHDVIEDCRVTYNDVKNLAGRKVADIVYALTNEKGRTRKERANNKYYEGIRNTPNATFVKLCDRLANVKYSVETNSKKLSMYKEEHEEFLRSLFTTDQARSSLKNIIEELEVEFIKSLKVELND